MQVRCRITLLNLDTEHGDKKMDPFIILRYGKIGMRSTVLRNGGRHCTWNETTGQFPVSEPDRLSLQVMDFDVGKSELIGVSAKLNLFDLGAGNAASGTFVTEPIPLDLSKPDDEDVQGQLFVKFEFAVLEEPFAVPTPAVAPRPAQAPDPAPVPSAPPAPCPAPFPVPAEVPERVADPAPAPALAPGPTPAPALVPGAAPAGPSGSSGPQLQLHKGERVEVCDDNFGRGPVTWYMGTITEIQQRGSIGVQLDDKAKHFMWIAPHMVKKTLRIPEQAGPAPLAPLPPQRKASPSAEVLVPEAKPLAPAAPEPVGDEGIQMLPVSFSSGHIALEAVSMERGAWNWIFFRASPHPESELIIYGGGSGSIDEMRACLPCPSDCPVLFGLLRLGFGSGKFKKYHHVFVTATNSDSMDGGSEVKVGINLAHKKGFQQEFAKVVTTSCEIEATAPDELEAEPVISHVASVVVVDNLEGSDGNGQITAAAFFQALDDDRREMGDVFDSADWL